MRSTHSTKGQGDCHRNQCQEVWHRGSVFSLLLLLAGVLLRKRGRGRQAFLMCSLRSQAALFKLD